MRLPNVLLLLAIVKISLGTYEAGFFRVSIDALPPGTNLWLVRALRRLDVAASPIGAHLSVSQLF
jgi:hypothetical protein